MRNSHLLGATAFNALRQSGLFSAKRERATARPSGNDLPRNPLRGYYTRYSHVLTEHIVTKRHPTRNQRKRANRAAR